MNDSVKPTAPTFASPKPEKRRRFPSIVWFAPLLALVVSVGVVWSNYNSRGPLIIIEFKSAAGIAEGTTEVRIRDLRVGVVEEVGFANGMATIEVRVRMDKEIAPYIDTDAQFWVVEPQVTARGITGIGTLLSGVYIAADWDSNAGASTDRFVALATPPLAAQGEEGTRILLKARAGGQLAAGAPVLTSGIEVGRIGQPTLSASGTTVTMEAFILKPYDERLTSNVRFWNASGLSVNIGAQGLAVNINSLAALIEGGVTFGSPVVGGEPVSDGQVFEVFSSETAARVDAFEADFNPDIPLSVLLDTDVNGVGSGTIVRFRGVKAGEVDDVIGITQEQGNDGTIKLRVDMKLSPRRLGLDPDMTRAEMKEILDLRVSNGLRARVGSEGLFGQTVVVELVYLRSDDEAFITTDDAGRLILPAAPPAVPDENSGVNGLMARVANLPIEDLMAAATQALTGVSELTGAAQNVLNADGVDRIPQTIEQTLIELNTLIADVRDGGAIENLNATLRSADGALKAVDGAARTLPALAQRLNSAADGLQSVIAGYDTNSRLYGDARAVLKELSSTADAFRSLARSIERNPNSLLTGRR